MKLLWWRKRPQAPEHDAERLTDLSPKRPSPFQAQLGRIRDGQDVEFEQLKANLRNKHF